MPDALEGLASLADQSLVQVEHDRDGEPWFSLLETVREHARERLRRAARPTRPVAATRPIT